MSATIFQIHSCHEKSGQMKVKRQTREKSSCKKYFDAFKPVIFISFLKIQNHNTPNQTMTFLMGYPLSDCIPSVQRQRDGKLTASRALEPLKIQEMEVGHTPPFVATRW